MNDCYYLGSRRELLWDTQLIDTEKSTTVTQLHHPVQRECVTFTQPWAKGSCPYMCVLQDGDDYRMYTKHDNGIICSVSHDGIHWEQPDLGLVEFEGSTHNSLVSFTFDPDFEDCGFDGFKVFVDKNPACKPEERFKMVANMHEKLQFFAGPDGFRFRHMGTLHIPGSCPNTPYDSVNTLFFDTVTGKYKAFVRDYYTYATPETESGVTCIRAISVSESDELFPEGGWPMAQFLEYNNPNVWQMYINSIMPYYRAPHIYIGFPSRYKVHEAWTPNYDELCGSKERLERSGPDKTNRCGISVSDTLFMTSRNGLNWTRYPNAFLTPGPEHPTNWVYGSVYFSNGIVETKSAHPDCDNEISFYCVENRWFPDRPCQVYRYSIRLDGFVSQFAPYPEADLYTKPFIFEGKDLFINFATSAYGYMKFTIQDEDGNAISSCETFGDSTDRRVRFEGDLSAFAGKPVTMHVNMYDADFYSFIFR